VDGRLRVANSNAVHHDRVAFQRRCILRPHRELGFDCNGKGVGPSTADW
jgi:hypothetical protein